MAQLSTPSTARFVPPASAQLDLAMDDGPTLPAGRQVGFELGWDHARHGIAPAVEHLFSTSPLRQGWQAGQATFGRRTLKAAAHTQRWLQLRTHAWARGRSFETTLLTPNYLQQLDTEHCPASRLPLNDVPGHAQQRRLDRVRDDAGYAAGHLAMMSRQANTAKGSRCWSELQAAAHSLQAGPIREMGGLDAKAWQRLAVLASFVTTLPHEEAAVLPLHVLPPNRLRLFNPIQALQALVTRQFATPGWSQRLARLEALLPHDELRVDFNRFVLAFVPRVLQQQHLQTPHEIRWALEDAWSHELVQRRWSRFALRLSADQAEQLVQRAAAKRLCPVHVQQHEAPAATEGWGLA
ncbi:hypothetical protein QRD43_02435 [Pelomonas sp. APW6]|uniref:Uncharacterized protein n=1 Tax=Roseateles subflavus TaxID=3053353 RepID=A0ABT7LGH1_9BURK|nr:hypothetical protein [Pelomonas sp. APW6]MDL5030750.1 hypothetical protein [Pelomonas sp. APW6]